MIDPVENHGEIFPNSLKELLLEKDKKMLTGSAIREPNQRQESLFDKEKIINSWAFLKVNIPITVNLRIFEVDWV